MENCNLFFNLPIELQDKIIKMNPHPLTNIFENGFKEEINDKSYYEMNKLWKRVYDNRCGRKYYSKMAALLYYEDF